MGFFPRATTDATACCSTTQPGRRCSTSWTRPCGGGRRAALPAPRARAVLSVLLFDPYISQRFKVLCFTGWLHRCAAIELFDSERARGERSPVRCRALPWPLARVQRRHAPQEWALKHKIGVGDVVPGGSSQAITFLFMAFHPEVERSGVPVVAVEAARCVEEE